MRECCDLSCVVMRTQPMLGYTRRSVFHIWQSGGSVSHPFVWENPRLPTTKWHGINMSKSQNWLYAAAALPKITSPKPDRGSRPDPRSRRVRHVAVGLSVWSTFSVRPSVMVFVIEVAMHRSIQEGEYEYLWAAVASHINHAVTIEVLFLLRCITFQRALYFESTRLEGGKLQRPKEQR